MCDCSGELGREWVVLVVLHACVCVCVSVCAIAGGFMMQFPGTSVMKQHEGRDYSN